MCSCYVDWPACPYKLADLHFSMEIVGAMQSKDLLEIRDPRYQMMQLAQQGHTCNPVARQK